VRWRARCALHAKPEPRIPRRAAYQSFLQLLLSAAGSADGAADPPAKKGSTGALDKRTALRCMCGLLQALPQFNYRSDLLRALVPRLASSDPVEAAMVNEAVTAVLADDKNGESTLETVQLIADLVKRRDCDAPACTLYALKAVRFDDSLGARLKDEREKGKPLTQKQRNRKWIEERRKLRDEAKAAARKPDAQAPAAAADDDLEDRTLRDFDAMPDANGRLALQTSTLEAVRPRL
jgi:nucleolar complex protein 3